MSRDLIGDLFDADVLAGEHGAEIDLLAAEADATTLNHGNRAIVEGVFQVLEAVIGAW
jgi:hypothetical protein